MKLKTKMRILEEVFVPVFAVLLLLDDLTKGQSKTLEKVMYEIDDNIFNKVERYHRIELERRWRDTCKILGRKYTKISELPKIGNKND